jgi:hypothetical protein
MQHASTIAASAADLDRDAKRLPECGHDKRQTTERRNRSKLCPSTLVAARRQTLESRAHHRVNLCRLELDVRRIGRAS